MSGDLATPKGISPPAAETIADALSSAAFNTNLDIDVAAKPGASLNQISMALRSNSRWSAVQRRVMTLSADLLWELDITKGYH